MGKATAKETLVSHRCTSNMFCLDFLLILSIVWAQVSYPPWNWPKDFFIPLLLGALIGLISGVGAALTLFNALSPRLEHCGVFEEKTNEHNEPGGYKYIVKLNNPLHATITDVSVVAELQLHFPQPKWT